MFIEKPWHLIEYVTPDAIAVIEAAAHICYQSSPSISPELFAVKLMQLGHMTPLEHLFMRVRLIVDRGISHEIVRHRLLSVTQESTRYCNYSKNKFNNQITVIDPFFWEQGSPEWLEWESACMFAEKKYFRLLETSTPEKARSVLPNSLKTELVLTANIREWRHIFKLRCAPTAHPQMREIMIPLLSAASFRIPIVFDDLVNKVME